MQTDLVAVEVLHADTQKNGQMNSHAEPNSQLFNYCYK
jgi:hypothetical protein